MSETTPESGNNATPESTTDKETKVESPAAKEPEITEDQSTKIMVMCARDQVLDALNALDKIKTSAEKTGKVSLQEVRKVMSEGATGELDIKICVASLQTIMHITAGVMKALEKKKVQDITTAAALLRAVQGITSGLQYIHSNASGIENVIRKKLYDLNVCEICGCIHDKEKWCRPDSFVMMKCTKCSNGSLTPRDAMQHVQGATCGQCGHTEWAFDDVTVEIMQKEMPGYGEGNMNETLEKRRKERPRPEQPDAEPKSETTSQPEPEKEEAKTDA